MFVSSEIIKVYFLLACVAVVSSPSGRSSAETNASGENEFPVGCRKGDDSSDAGLFSPYNPRLEYTEYFHSVFVAIDNMSAKRLGEFMFSQRHRKVNMSDLRVICI